MELIDYLTRGSSQQPTDLSALGKQAATEHLAGKASLRELVKSAAAKFSLNHAQVSRVCEAANNAAFGLMKTAGQAIVEFDVVHPDDIMASLCPQGPSIEKRAQVRLTPLSQKHVEWIRGARGQDVEQLIFGPASETEKTAAVHLNERLEMVKVAEVYREARDVRDHLESELCSAEMMVKSAMTRFLSASRQYILDGGSYPDLEYGLDRIINDAAFAKNATAQARAHVDELESMTHKRDWVEKRSHAMLPDTGHPIALQAQNLYKIACEYSKLKDRHQLVVAKEKQAKAWIQEHAA